MEKFSQFRDRGSGISPFMPITTPTSKLYAVPRAFLFLLRLPLFIGYAILYFALLQHLQPLLPTAVRKLLLWCMMGIPGIWWVDLQIDGVKRGRLASQAQSQSQASPSQAQAQAQARAQALAYTQRLPHPGSVIAANFTSPVDALYLAAVFDPIFVVGYPGSRKVRRVSLLGAVAQALSPASLVRAPPPPSRNNNNNTNGLTDLRALREAHPDRVIAIFPECATTNGRGILPLGPSLLALPADARIFPVSLRYTPPDITTPVPGAWAGFLWKLLSRPTHCIRVRIAEPVYNTSRAATNGVTPPATAAVSSDEEEEEGSGEEEQQRQPRDESDTTPEEQLVLDRVAEALARLGRNKRVGLTVRDKARFVEAWNKRR